MSISVGVVCYNHEPFLDQCLDSLLAQTLPPEEIIIGDDFSTDQSWQIIQKYQKNNSSIKAYRHSKNNGAFYNGTFIARKLNGEFLSIIDGDDYWLPEKLEMEYKAIQRSGADIAYSDTTIITDDNKVRGCWTKRPEIPQEGNIFIATLARRFFYESHSLFRNELISRKAFKNEGECDPTLQNFWDWDRKIRYTKSFCAAFSSKNLVYYRQHPGGISKTFGQANLFETMIQVYEKHLLSLSSRSLYNQLFVQISFETLAAKQKKQLGLSGHEKYSYPNVAQRISKLFTKLTAEEQAALKTVFSKEIQELFVEESSMNFIQHQHAASPLTSAKQANSLNQPHQQLYSLLI